MDEKTMGRNRMEDKKKGKTCQVDEQCFSAGSKTSLENPV